MLAAGSKIAIYYLPEYPITAHPDAYCCNCSEAQYDLLLHDLADPAPIDAIQFI